MSDHSDKEKDNQLDDKKYKDEKIEKEASLIAVMFLKPEFQ